jgi:predicted N-acetyltransferase YhbS
MSPADIDRLGEIDRSEHVTAAYTANGEALARRPVDWQVPAWFAEGSGEHTIAGHIAGCREILDDGGLLLGAFAEERLVGIGLLRPRLHEEMAQLAFLHVSRPYRRRGVAARLTGMMCRRAAALGARQIYVSATPSAGTIAFYLAQGFKPTAEPDPELLGLEPEDIHMIKPLQ